MLHYDLKELYCTSPFRSRCSHRMAGTGCDFSRPESGARALIPDELVIVENAPEKIATFIRKMTVRSS